jgi:hypothetical protein
VENVIQHTWWDNHIDWYTKLSKISLHLKIQSFHIYDYLKYIFLFPTYGIYQLNKTSILKQLESSNFGTSTIKVSENGLFDWWNNNRVPKLETWIYM